MKSLIENFSREDLELQLAENTRILETAFELAGLGVWQYDLLNDKVYLDANCSFMIGKKREAAIISYETFINYIHPEDKNEFVENLEMVIVEGNSINYINRANFPATGLRMISTKAQAIANAQGSVVKIIGVSQDITEKQRIKDNLQISKEKATVLFDYSPIIIWEEDFSEIKKFIEQLKSEGVTDFKKYFESNVDIVKHLASTVKITSVNKTSLDFYNVSSKEELLQNLADWFVDDSWDLFTRELVALAKGALEFEGNVEIISPSGKHLTLYLKLSVPPQFANTFEVVLVSFIDITELKRNEQLLLDKEKKIREYSMELEQMVLARTMELSDSESKLKIANSIAELGSWEMERNGAYLDCSERFLQIYNLPKGSKPSIKDIINFVHIEDKQVARDHFEIGLESGEKHSCNFRIVLNDGSIKYIYSATQNSILNSDGGVQKIIGINQDVSEIKRIEEIRSQMDGIIQGQEKERERISAELHDSINPLLSLANLNIETVLDVSADKVNTLDDKLKKTMGLLENAIEGIREISKNLSPATLKRFGLVKGLEQLSNQVRETTSIQVTLNVHGLEERPKFNIELTFYRVTQEMINNILKYAKATTIDIQLIEHENSILLSVIDDGVGFDVKYEESQGPGIGLKSLRSRVEGLSGTLIIDSSPNNGTTLIAEIPT